LTKLAFMSGFDVDEVWNHSKNAEVKELRQDHHILAPGDVVYVPPPKKEGQPISKGTVNSYTANVPKVGVSLVFRDRDGKPWANEPCMVFGLAADFDLDAPPEHKLDQDGKLSLMVPVHVREIQVVFYEKNHASFNVRVGEMDPIDEPSGVTKRLCHM